MIESSREKMLQQMVMGSVPEEIARQCQKPFVMVKATEGLKLLLKRII